MAFYGGTVIDVVLHLLGFRNWQFLANVRLLLFRPYLPSLGLASKAPTELFRAKAGCELFSDVLMCMKYSSYC
ncbi:hypothetical protein D3C76_480980 [compost metagenome]